MMRCRKNPELKRRRSAMQPLVGGTRLFNPVMTTDNAAENFRCSLSPERNFIEFN